MSRLLKFDDFERDKKPAERQPAPNPLPPVRTVQENSTMQNKAVEDKMREIVWKGVMESSYFTSDEKTGIFRAMKAAGIDNKALNESILTRMRETLPKLKEEGVEVKEEVIDKLEKVMKSSSAFSKYLADLVLKAWDRVLGFYKTKLDPSKADALARLKQLRKEGTDLNNNINVELGGLKDLSMFWLKIFPGMVAKAMLQNYAKAIMKESLEVSADIHSSIMKFSPNKLNEDNAALWAFMDDITDQLKEVPPFKTLGAVRSFDGVSPDKFADAFVKFTADNGGPSGKKYEMLPVVMEEVVKHRNGSLPGDMKDQILKSEGVLKFLPMNKEILTIIEALAITVVSMEVMMKIKDDTGSVYKK